MTTKDDGGPPRQPAGSLEQEASVTLTTDQIERIISNFVAERGGVREPFVYKIKWLWSIGKGPLCHVTVTRAPENVRPFRRDGKKGSP